VPQNDEYLAKIYAKSKSDLDVVVKKAQEVLTSLHRGRGGEEAIEEGREIL